jgi:hypothetical protein
VSQSYSPLRRLHGIIPAPKKKIERRFRLKDYFTLPFITVYGMHFY